MTSNNSVALFSRPGGTPSGSCSSDKPWRSGTWGMVSATWCIRAGRAGERDPLKGVNEVVSVLNSGVTAASDAAELQWGRQSIVRLGNAAQEWCPSDRI